MPGFLIGTGETAWQPGTDRRAGRGTRWKRVSLMNLSEYASYDALGLSDLVRSKSVTAGELVDCALRASALDVMSVVHRGEAARPTCHKKHEGCSGGPSRASTHEGRTMGKYSEVFVGIDTAKSKHAVAIADTGRDGETRYLGEIDSAPATIERVIKKLAGKYEKVRVCYEAGPTGYGLYRQIVTLGHECAVVAPSLIPKKAGDRIKTNRRDAVTLARLFRAGELTAVWVPDAVHEAVRDLVRARETAAADVRKKRQQLLSFLLRHGRIYSGSKHWAKAHARWLATQAFEHPAQQIVFQDAIDAIEDCARRLQCLEEQLHAVIPNWSWRQ